MDDVNPSPRTSHRSKSVSTSETAYAVIGGWYPEEMLDTVHQSTNIAVASATTTYRGFKFYGSESEWLLDSLSDGRFPRDVKYNERVLRGSTIRIITYNLNHIMGHILWVISCDFWVLALHRQYVHQLRPFNLCLTSGYCLLDGYSVSCRAGIFPSPSVLGSALARQNLLSSFRGCSGTAFRRE